MGIIDQGALMRLRRKNAKKAAKPLTVKPLPAKASPTATAARARGLGMGMGVGRFKNNPMDAGDMPMRGRRGNNISRPTDTVGPILGKPNPADAMNNLGLEPKIKIRKG